MAQNKTPSLKKSGLTDDRAANLRANLARRKEQARARNAPAAAILSPNKEPEECNTPH